MSRYVPAAKIGYQPLAMPLADSQNPCFFAHARSLIKHMRSQKPTLSTASAISLDVVHPSESSPS